MGKLGTLYGFHAGGVELQIEASISQVKAGEGKLYTVIVRDVTARKEAEAALQAKTDEIKSMTQQLWHTARLATMGELAASIAHELNNPLAS
jgi:C4-dicarboxylate-specific signal transduction histidine kinase